jgi:short subunit fatty acids transporter
LGITGLSARDILPYTAVAMLLGLVIFAVALSLF